MSTVIANCGTNTAVNGTISRLDRAEREPLAREVQLHEGATGSRCRQVVAKHCDGGDHDTVDHELVEAFSVE
ncbi:hypothetical protein OG889_04340 [Streptomyces sp. NBC_00481]|uniref:hypothetical protein n=1 Tax=unclassified Streptomyces TaxID=2593676 RepID=UPI002DDBFADE|nr:MULTISPECIES: hypothetical protein [unclassified Streptomyces]WRY94018.1 hypothetical protein OG889_04340 [Streptomyces sp. NBC_00481]